MMLTFFCDMLIFKQKVTKNMIFGLGFVFAAIVMIEKQEIKKGDFDYETIFNYAFSEF